MEFKDKVVWITGASSGIGEALAYAFHREGGRLVLSSRRAAELERVRGNCYGGDGRILVLPLDLTDFQALPRHVEAVLAAFGQIDILVNNGGIGQHSRAAETPIAVDQLIMQTNFLGQVALTKAVLPAMLQRKSGHIAVMSSVTGKLGAPNRSAYAASKHALHGFFDSLRAEVSQEGIRVTLVCPGFVRTNLRANALQEDGMPRGDKASVHTDAVSPEACAAATLRAIRAGKEEVYVGRQRYAVYANRLFPGLVSLVLRRMPNL